MFGILFVKWYHTTAWSLGFRYINTSWITLPVNRQGFIGAYTNHAVHWHTVIAFSISVEMDMSGWKCVAIFLSGHVAPGIACVFTSFTLRNDNNNNRIQTLYWFRIPNLIRSRSSIAHINFNRTIFVSKPWWPTVIDWTFRDVARRTSDILWGVNYLNTVQPIASRFRMVLIN